MQSEEISIEKILEEDTRRRHAMSTPYDPVTAELSPGTRFQITIPELDPPTIHIPAAMQELPEVTALMKGRYLTDVFPG